MKITSWRIVQSKNVSGAFDGEGARINPGRWNHRGTPMVYTASSLALAALEMLVHLGASASLELYMFIPVTFDDSLFETISIRNLPIDWMKYPAPSSTRDIGTEWAKTNASVVLAVPSVIINTEVNFLINPSHPDFIKLDIGIANVFNLDERLLK